MPDEVTITERVLDLGGELHLLEAGPRDGRPVLLLHGAAFHSGTWRELGTIERLAREGFRVVALDLPGFGKSGAAPSFTLQAFVEEMGLERPVIVAPSMSGRFAFPLLVEHPELVGGFVPVAPVAIEAHAEKLATVDVPALVVWGESDRMFPVAGADRLQGLLRGSRKVVLEGAPHPAYLERTDEFHEALLEFLGQID